MEGVLGLLGAQVPIINVGKYENELQIVRHLHKNRSICERHAQDVFGTLDSIQYWDDEEQREKSERLRTLGNKILNEKNSNLIHAIRIYTDGIFAAPLGEPLALMHANRAVALQQFGYYEQAYDDCVIALEQGYPERLKTKVLCRQAYCAWKIGNVTLLEYHLDELEKRELQKNFKLQVEQLRSASKEMQNNDIVYDDRQNKQSKDHILMQSSLDVVQAPEPKGRHFIANRKIAENEVICVERAPSFVKISERGICEYCANIMFIPFPCKHCHSRVVYCSLSCLKQHFDIHEIECPGTRFCLFLQIGVAHLAFRMMIDGLSQLLPLLNKQTNIDQLWNELICGTALKTDYGCTLQMVTPFHKTNLTEIVRCAQTADVLLIYLKKYTKFFDKFATFNWTIPQIELLISSLILRHIGQVMVNGFVFASIIPKRNGSYFGLLQDDLWCRPFRIKRGQLHAFSNYEAICTINFPYMSIANHSCDPSFTPRFSGRYLSAYANKTIAPGCEVTHAYIETYLISRSIYRRNKLQSIYHFDCSCNKCGRQSPDIEFETFRKYRCEYDDCQWVFNPISDDELSEVLFCDNCARRQSKAWLVKFNNLLKCVNNASARKMLYSYFHKLDRWLVDFNIKKLQLGYAVIEECFGVLDAGVILEDNEFVMLVKIIRFVLEGIEKLYRVNSMQYVAKMLYLWDIMALGKYKCTVDEMQKMLLAIEITPDEIKIICMNYFEDYISSQLLNKC